MLSRHLEVWTYFGDVVEILVRARVELAPVFDPAFWHGLGLVPGLPNGVSLVEIGGKLTAQGQVLGVERVLLAEGLP